MKILKFDNFVNERYEKTVKDYAVGDTVLIRYNLTGDVTPVKIIDKKSHSYFIVSHKVEGSHLYNAPDHGVKVDEIIGRTSGVAYMDNDQTTNPNIKPDTSGIIPGWNSFSNDISF
ncbi:MAG: hypothetical protein WDA02_11360 [Saccharofermentanales bacterium]